MVKIKIGMVFWVVLIFTTSCFHRDDAAHHIEHQTINQQLNAKSIDSIQYDVTIDEYLRTLDKVQVKGIEGEVFIPSRSKHLSSFPCSNCHTESMSELGSFGMEEGKKAHWNIEIQHAGTEVMNCLTCHDTDDPGQLNSLTGKKIGLDHSYRLCSQCHSTQYKEWQGGAHGKRLGGWAPPRVINSCVHCHNPHSPAFESRWPARLNTVKLIEQTSD